MSIRHYGLVIGDIVKTPYRVGDCEVISFDAMDNNSCCIKQLSTGYIFTVTCEECEKIKSKMTTPKTLRGILSWNIFGKKYDDLEKCEQSVVDKAKTNIEVLKTCEHGMKNKLSLSCVWCELTYYKKRVEILEAQQKKMGNT